MIENEVEYSGALRDLEHMERSLTQLMSQPLKRPDFDRLSVRRMIARLQEELAQYEAHVDRLNPVAGETEKRVVLSSTP